MKVIKIVSRFFLLKTRLCYSRNVCKKCSIILLNFQTCAATNPFSPPCAIKLIARPGTLIYQLIFANLNNTIGKLPVRRVCGLDPAEVTLIGALQCCHFWKRGGIRLRRRRDIAGKQAEK